MYTYNSCLIKIKYCKLHTYMHICICIYIYLTAVEQQVLNGNENQNNDDITDEGMHINIIIILCNGELECLFFGYP